jgi:cation:H+ antiporter
MARVAATRFGETYDAAMHPDRALWHVIGFLSPGPWSTQLDITAVVLLLGCAAVIYFSCEAFVNGVEWLGHRLHLGQTATGTVLAAFGTALPESVVTLVAVAFGSTPAQKEIGIGAALGGPLALSTVAYAVVGVAVLFNARRGGRQPDVEVNARRLRRDQLWFLAIFAVKIILGVVVFSFKPWLGILFLAAYGLYTWRELSREEASFDEQDLQPLKIRPRDPAPALGWAILQTAAALLIIFAASRVFVKQLEVVGSALGLDPQLAALLFSPIATELPEVMNAVIWVRQGKERLALANISGAMMIQATVPTAFGLFFTSWILSASSILAAIVTAVAVMFLQWVFRSQCVNSLRLAQVGWLYAVFAAVLIARQIASPLG